MQVINKECIYVPISTMYVMQIFIISFEKMHDRQLNLEIYMKYEYKVTFSTCSTHLLNFLQQFLQQIIINSYVHRVVTLHNMFSSYILIAYASSILFYPEFFSFKLFYILNFHTHIHISSFFLIPLNFKLVTPLRNLCTTI